MSPHTPQLLRAARSRVEKATCDVAPLRRPGAMSMASALPLITGGIVVAVLAITLALTSVTLRRTAMESAHERVVRATRQLKVLVDNSVRQLQGRLIVASRDSAVRRLVTALPASRQAPDSAFLARVDEALALVPLGSDSTPLVELWTEDGRLAHAYGRHPRIVKGIVPEFPNAEARPPERFGIDGFDDKNEPRVGRLFDCAGRGCYWAVQRIREGDRTIGYIAYFRHLVTNPTTDRTLRELGGGAMRLYFGNRDGSTWSSVSGLIAEPPRTLGNGMRYRPKIGEVVYADEPIYGVPFVLSAEIPRADILAPSRTTLRRLAGVSAVLMLIGAAIAWLIGRRLTRPLVTLTEAAERVAGGEYDVRVSLRGAAEVESLADSFNHMAEQVGASLREVEAASRAKSDFLATMSHELRTPLNAIGGYVELLEMELRGPITDLQRHDLARIRQSQAHLLSLISAVLDLSRFERGQVSYELSTLPLHPFLAGLDALVAPQAAAKRLTLVHEPGDATLAVVADREKLRQVLLNLLSNAIRYTPAGGTISLGAHARDGDTVTIHVRDTGPGIPPERQEEIFEPFVQLDRTLTQSREGVGLGLAISRDLARGMGGGLYVESKPGGGACFIVELPRGDIDEAPTFATTAEMSAVTAKGASRAAPG